jgi:hypothetical protein
LHASKIIGLDPIQRYTRSFEHIRAANAIDPAAITRVEKYIAPDDTNESITLRSLVDEAGASRVDFLKCDIEGCEYTVMRSDPETMAKVINLAMEVHPSYGDTKELIKYLESTGMTVIATDQHGKLSAPEVAHYLYGSRDGKLRS